MCMLVSKQPGQRFVDTRTSKVAIQPSTVPKPEA